MDKIVFRNCASIVLQGESALEFVEQANDHVIYRVVGFPGKRMMIHDYRTYTFSSLEHFFKTNDPQSFQEDFTTPAWALVKHKHLADILIELHLCQRTEPEFTLWIAIGIEKSVPAFDYVLFESEPISENRFALVYLYQNPLSPPEDSALSHFDSCVQTTASSLGIV